MSDYTQLTQLHYDGRGLPPARGPAPADSDRDRLQTAVIRLVARNGYEDTTVSQVITAAQVTPGVFNRQYPGKEECFLDACLTGLGHLAAELGQAAVAAPADPPEAVLEATLGGFLGFLAAHPDYARCFLLDMPSVGAEARHRHLAVIDLLSDNTRRWHARVAGPAAVLHLDVYRLLGGGVAHLCTAHAHDGSLAEIPGLLPSIMQAHLAILLPGRAARDEVRSSRRRSGPGGGLASPITTCRQGRSSS